MPVLKVRMLSINLIQIFNEARAPGLAETLAFHAAGAVQHQDHIFRQLRLGPEARAKRQKAVRVGIVRSRKVSSETSA
jgi:hypothetical protein